MPDEVVVGASAGNKPCPRAIAKCSRQAGASAWHISSSGVLRQATWPLIKGYFPESPHNRHLTSTPRSRPALLDACVVASCYHRQNDMGRLVTNGKGRLYGIGCVLLAVVAGGCPPVMSSGPIIQKYKAATCIPFSSTPRVSPHTREWDTPVSLRDGLQAVVIGAQIPGGRVSVRYLPANRVVVAADPGDYVYPSDVRIDGQKDFLYTKAYGLAGGLTEETWLFKYDLHGERITERRRIKNGILPAECPDVPAGR